ncbi:MAG: ABC transporter ATP-binding protein [Clostridia bacterium]|nr:ABC transporter ATP-binding protein [Clostridia bacterium]
MDEKELPVSLSVKDVEIAYRVVKPLRLSSLIKNALKSTPKQKKFHAVKGISFEVKRGEIVGLIGKNGSGKSTLLRAIANIYSPDKGSIDTYGNTVGLMAIGVGFQNLLSGRENIYLSGMLMGFNKKQIQEKEQEIIDFSELGSFIDEPVASYSSGMHSKLAFSITAIMETDIVLVDETLSVGDIAFKQKSLAKMKELIRRDDKTVLIVSHSIPTLLELCHRVIWMHDGVMKMDGDPQEVLDRYCEFMNANTPKTEAPH